MSEKRSYEVRRFTPTGSEPFDPPRFRVVDVETGKVLDDAQGYGYKTVQKAHAAWAYKNRTPGQHAASKVKMAAARSWLKAHPDFMEQMDQEAFLIVKGSCGPNDKFDTAHVRKMLKEAGLTCDVPVGDLLKAWRKM